MVSSLMAAQQQSSTDALRRVRQSEARHIRRCVVTEYWIRVQMAVEKSVMMEIQPITMAVLQRVCTMDRIPVPLPVARLVQRVRQIASVRKHATPARRCVR